MIPTHSKLPLRAHKKIWIVFVVMLTVFVSLTIANEVLDLPHFIFGDDPTSYSQRKGEVIFELLIYFIVISSSFYYFRHENREGNQDPRRFYPHLRKLQKN